MRFRNKFKFAILLLLTLSFSTHTQTYSKEYKVIRGSVTNISDGDTVVIRPLSGKLFKCRLYGIDAPEISHNGNPGQPYGQAADRELTNLVLHTTVDITLTGNSSFDREICIIKKMGVDINREMVIQGYAWAYREYLEGPYASEYIDAETEARKMRRGLWQQMNPTPPWEFRKKHR